MISVLVQPVNWSDSLASEPCTMNYPLAQLVLVTYKTWLQFHARQLAVQGIDPPPCVFHFLGQSDVKASGSTEDGHNTTPPPNGDCGATKPSSTAWHNTRKMIYVKTTNMSQVWPLPESFWPETHTVTLVYTCTYVHP